MDDDDDFTALRDAQHQLTARRYARLMQTVTPDSPIAFYESVVIDDYCTVTVGEWGGYLVQIMPMLYNDRLVLTPQSCPYVYDHGWCYDKGPAALLAALVWNPQTQGEPVGYKKCATPGVRQPGERPAETPRGAEQAASLMAVLDTITRRVR